MSKKANNDNRSRQLNPKDVSYWDSRGQDYKPEPAPSQGGKPCSDVPAKSSGK